MFTQEEAESSGSMSQPPICGTHSFLRALEIEPQVLTVATHLLLHP